MKNAPMLVLAIGISTSFGLIMGTIFSSHTVETPASPQSNITPIHFIQWHSLKEITLKHMEFLDLADTTPILTVGGHVAMYIPCDDSGRPAVQFMQGIVDTDKNTLAPVEPEYIKGLSSPGDSCLYHFDIGTPEGVTDFAILNNGSKPVDFDARHTITFSIDGIRVLHN